MASFPQKIKLTVSVFYFLILNFRRVLIAVSFLLGISRNDGCVLKYPPHRGDKFLILNFRRVLIVVSFLFFSFLPIRLAHPFAP